MAALALVKAAVLLVLGRLFRLAPGDNVLFALALAQGGEFAFVLFSFASANRVLPASLTSLLVVAVDEPSKSLEIVELARKHFPGLEVLARAFDRQHAYALIRLGVRVIRRETFGSALEMGVDALERLGMHPHRAHRAAHTFRCHDEAALREVAALEGDDAARIARSRQLSEELERLLQSDREDLGEERNRAWDVSALREPETR